MDYYLLVITLAAVMVICVVAAVAAIAGAVYSVIEARSWWRERKERLGCDEQ